MNKFTVFLLFLLMSVVPFVNVQAATINISNNCNQNVTVYAYSRPVDNASDLLAEKVAYAHNSYTLTTTSPVKCIKTTYPQPGNSTVGNYFYFSGANNLMVNIGWNNNACSISVTE